MIDPALVARFKAALDRLNPSGERIGLAVSGGPDSMAMLLLAHAAIPGAFEVATVNHGLRAEAADECALVAAACAERGVECAVLEVTVGAGNVQEEAREARYFAIGRWTQERNLPAVATAHHADDQTETMLMRLNRGSGLTGLTGVRERLVWPVPTYQLWRPLLGFRHAELAELVARVGLAVAADPSNADPAYDRVRVRQAIAEADWLKPAGLAQSAEHLAEAHEALSWAADREVDEQVVFTPEMARYRPRAPRAVRLMVASRLLFFLGGRARGGDVARLIDRLEDDGQGNVAGVLVTVEDGDWVFRPEPPRRTG
ncbi:MAG: tRNA lysidine(34) synthetase TilS [Alteraurantiacibacter sp.]